MHCMVVAVSLVLFGMSSVLAEESGLVAMGNPADCSESLLKTAQKHQAEAEESQAMAIVKGQPADVVAKVVGDVAAAYDRVIAGCNAALDERPDDAGLLSLRGSAHLERGNYQLAESDFGAMIKIGDSAGLFEPGATQAGRAAAAFALNHGVTVLSDLDELAALRGLSWSDDYDLWELLFAGKYLHNGNAELALALVRHAYSKNGGTQTPVLAAFGALAYVLKAGPDDDANQQAFDCDRATEGTLGGQRLAYVYFACALATLGDFKTRDRFRAATTGSARTVNSIQRAIAKEGSAGRFEPAKQLIAAMRQSSLAAPIQVQPVVSPANLGAVSEAAAGAACSANALHLARTHQAAAETNRARASTAAGFADVKLRASVDQELGEVSSEYDRLIAACTAAISRAPSDSELIALRGFAHLDRRNYERAAADFSALIEQGYTSALFQEDAAYLGRAAASAALNRTDTLVADVDVLMVRSGPRASVVTQIFAYANEYAVAEALTRATYRHWGKATPLGLAFEAWALSLRNAQYDDFAADDICDRAVSLGEGEPQVHFICALAWLRQDYTYDAQKQFIAAARRKPGDTRALDPVQMAAAQEGAEGRFDAAKRLIEGLKHTPLSVLPQTGTLNPAVVTIPDEKPRAADDTDKKQDAVPETRVALVIGNAKYDAASELFNPPRDAAAVADALEKIGFKPVIRVSDGDEAEINRKLDEFKVQAAAADWAVVYYSGHGMQVDGKNYLIPVDARIATKQDVAAKTISLDTLVAATSGARKLNLIILDACRNNPFKLVSDDDSKRIIVEEKGLAGTTAGDIAVGGNLAIMFAAAEDQVALDGPREGNSPFAAALVKRMIVPGVEIDRLVRQVRTEVLDVTGNKQRPFFSSSLPDEDFFFVATGQ